MVNLTKFLLTSTPLIYRAATFLCLVTHLACVTVWYLAFLVDTSMDIDIDLHYGPGDQYCSFCTPSSGIMNQTFRGNVTLADSLTVKQIRDLTPDSKYFLQQIEVKDQFTSRLYTITENLHDYVTVTKSTVGYYVCYTMVLDNDGIEEFMKPQRTSRPSMSNTLINFYINESSLFTQADHYRIMLHRGSLPYEEFDFAPVIRRDLANPDSLIGNKVEIYPQIINIERLPPPYESNCTSYYDMGFTSYSHCFQSCFANKTMQRFGRIPLSAMVDTSVDMRILYPNDDMRDELEMMMIDCTEFSCISKDCYEDIVLTIASELLSKNFTITIVSPRSPNFNIHTRNVQALPDYIFYIIGLIGNYMGLCVLSLEPVSLYRLCRKIFKRENRIAGSRSTHDSHSCSHCHQTMILMIRFLREEAERRRRR